MSTRRVASTLDAGEEVPGYGVSRSWVSERWGRYAQQQLERRLSERLEGYRFVALISDAVIVNEHVVVVALGVDADGHKRLLGLREGATENATVVRELLEDLVNRGLQYDEGVLIVIDGSKCRTRSKPTSRSDLKPTTDSGRNRPAVPAEADQ